MMRLYRALREAEIAAGNILLPKSQSPFRTHARLRLVLPFNLGEREEHAVREHQWDGRFPTRGVSCTTAWSVAVRYASANKIVVRIDVEVCKRIGIRCFRVRDYVPAELIEHPEDEEVILVWEQNGAFPKVIVAEAINIDGSSTEIK